jgi:hypothetical protein
MATELISDKTPMYVHNRHTTYENTVLQEHSSIVSGLKNTATSDAQTENQCRLFIGFCMKNKGKQLIADKWDVYFKDEMGKINPGLPALQKHDLASTRTWLNLVNDAMDYYMNKYKVDGSRAKIAVLDDITTDGRRIVDVSEVAEPQFTEDEEE